ncbi:hypothetical protein GGD65_008072 [Bradyrhizobium sp. CIR18]|uniref:hypothetical protein n=1 Tax=Bradyrhizobium sp. CIR18 TaxID=2663839 RepID=UPI0016065E63|nr:hypothetical protein [Bradyrhizobium sp. CIR18]MBB4366998.1 hypothetical protein [Bradyrhizobium sp. CIR18]
MTNRLTAKAAAKLSALADEVDQAGSLVDLTMRRIRESQAAMRNINQEADPDRWAALEGEVQRLHGRREIEQTHHARLARQVAGLRSWLDTLPVGVELTDVPVVEWHRDESDDLQECVEIVRIELEQLLNTRKSVANSVPPVEDLYLQADAHVEALAKQGAPSIRVENGHLRVQHGSGWTSSGAEAIAMLAWLNADQLADALHARIDELRAEELRRGLVVMHPDDRKRKLADLDHRIRALELEEEFYVVRAKENGLTIPRRDKASPAAVLGLAVVPRRSEIAA